ncbi:Sjoegren syndrome/scleroderma autoantigen 1 [Orchesella cincta]|uniref:Sjoegren syndrome/scleroderma autoantigen 1 n=1 Tax=Orchesella cincta TaxID=48709 RepID=A0A1D2NK09_ORCCI|nr:Sjoegren syndrome/scleroderma autoantigen 1 [Orchesella cincta]
MSVSETIGKLLLEGNKMLAESCDVCSTVLMQDRRGRVICVKCESESMANAVGRMDDVTVTATGKFSNGNNFHQESGIVQRTTQNGSNPSNPTIPSTIAAGEELLLKEIQLAISAMQPLNHQVDMQAKLCYIKYIRECADTIKSLQALKK